MKARKLKSLLFAVSGCFYAVLAYSATSLFSDYGQIQNVQNYSTNPFWTPNSPYNQKMPQPVYVQGNKVSTDECMQIVQSAVSVQCMARNNCRNTTLADIRPAIVVSLSSLPNKAYSTACIGYLDSVYESYVAQHGGNNTFKTNTVSTVVMPTTTTNVVQGSGIVLQNPFVKTDPQWKQDIADRAQELKSLQRQNNSGDWKLSASKFPNTINDLSFSDQIAIKAADYANYKGTTAYRTLMVENAHEWCNGKGAGSHECQEYFCEEKAGPKANTAECIKYRCETKTGYKETHKEECACGVNPSSDTCKDYMCSLDTNYAKSQECHSHKCKRDGEYRKKHKKECICEESPNSDECMMQKCYNGANKPNPNGGTGCEAWLCQNDTKYRKDNQQSCICAKNSKSAECLSLKCYKTKTEKENGKNVTKKVPDDTLTDCKTHLCTYDADYIDKHGEDCACLKEPYGKLCAQYKCFKDGKYSTNIDDWVYKDRPSGAYDCCNVYCDANKDIAMSAVGCGCNLSNAFGGGNGDVNGGGVNTGVPGGINPDDPNQKINNSGGNIFAKYYSLCPQPKINIKEKGDNIFTSTGFSLKTDWGGVKVNTETAVKIVKELLNCADLDNTEYVIHERSNTAGTDEYINVQNKQNNEIIPVHFDSINDEEPVENRMIVRALYYIAKGNHDTLPRCMKNVCKLDVTQFQCGAISSILTSKFSVSHQRFFVESDDKPCRIIGNK